MEKDKVRNVEMVGSEWKTQRIFINIRTKYQKEKCTDRKQKQLSVQAAKKKKRHVPKRKRKRKRI